MPSIVSKRRVIKSKTKRPSTHYISAITWLKKAASVGGVNSHLTIEQREFVIKAQEAYRRAGNATMVHSLAEVRVGTKHLSDVLSRKH